MTFKPFLVALILLTPTHFSNAMEQGAAGSPVHPFCKPHNLMMGYISSPPNQEEIFRMRLANIPTGQTVGVLEWTENDDTGTWSVLIATPSGLTCLLFYGVRESKPS